MTSTWASRPRALIRAWKNVVGRRGTFLLFIALLDLSYAHGVAYPTETAQRSGFVTLLADVAPLWLWAAFFAAVGVVAVAQAFMRRDAVAFALAALMKLLLAALALLGWAAGEIERGYISAAIWGAFAAITIMIAGWPECRDEN